MSRQGPVSLSAELDRYLASLGLPQVSLLVSLRKAWPGIAGPALAGKTIPARFRNGVLTVAVRNHAWAQELQLAKSALLSRIAEAEGPKCPVKDVRFSVEAGFPPEAEEEAPPAEPPAQLPDLPDPEGLSRVADPETRESLRTIHRQAGRRRKTAARE